MSSTQRDHHCALEIANELITKKNKSNEKGLRKGMKKNLVRKGAYHQNSTQHCKFESRRIISAGQKCHQ